MCIACEYYGLVGEGVQLCLLTGGLLGRDRRRRSGRVKEFIVTVCLNVIIHG